MGVRTRVLPLLMLHLFLGAVILTGEVDVAGGAHRPGRGTVGKGRGGGLAHARRGLLPRLGPLQGLLSLGQHRAVEDEVASLLAEGTRRSLAWGGVLAGALSRAGAPPPLRLET